MLAFRALDPFLAVLSHATPDCGRPQLVTDALGWGIIAALGQGLEGYVDGAREVEILSIDG